MSKESAAEAQPKELTIIDRLKSPAFADRIKQALGTKANVEEFLSNTLIEISRSEDLKKCTWDSIMQCAIDSANFGLVPNKQLGHAFLIPYKNYNRKTKQSVMECTLQIGYKGYVKKFAEYGMTVETETVTYDEVDQGKFEEHRGSNPLIMHRPIRTGIRNRENIALAYAIGRAPGKSDIITVMSRQDIEEAVKSEYYDYEKEKKVFGLKGAWVDKGASGRATDFGELCKKTAIRRLAKISDIDVVNKMSSYEGERDMKDVTPEKPEQQPSVLSSVIAKAKEMQASAVQEQPSLFVQEPIQHVVEDVVYNAALASIIEAKGANELDQIMLKMDLDSFPLEVQDNLQKASERRFEEFKKESKNGGQ